MNYLKSLKDGKRRAVESVLEATGKSERTVDENYEIDYEQYQELIHFIEHSKRAVQSLLQSQQGYYENMKQHAGFLHDMHEKNNNPTNPSYTVIYLLLGDQCQSYLSAANRLNDIYR
jgi:hypothetical protein